MDVFGKKTMYLPWESGQGGYDHQDCVVLREADGLYNDVPCDELNPFVCELNGKSRRFSYVSTLFELQWGCFCLCLVCQSLGFRHRE